MIRLASIAGSASSMATGESARRRSLAVMSTLRRFGERVVS